ncbi:hypothetical protein [Streptomyces arboris]|uniref:hypothetical protein n=1 Tax=Streptomyces arboris TaxID=2600619 RepID=UPI003BF54862
MEQRVLPGPRRSLQSSHSREQRSNGELTGDAFRMFGQDGSGGTRLSGWFVQVGHWSSSPLSEFPDFDDTIMKLCR